jgi:hypothetical protein
VESDLRPGRLEFWLGGARRDTVWRLRWSAGKVEFQVLPPESEESDQEHTTALFSPSRAQWAEFWRAVDDGGVWAWSRRYGSPPGDSSWKLEIGRGDRLVRSAGDGAYPPAGSPLPTPEFGVLLDALRELIDGRSIG